MEQTSYVVDDFVREWKKVWEAVACLPNFESDIKGRLLVDLSNEPDSQWQVRQCRIVWKLWVDARGRAQVLSATAGHPVVARLLSPSPFVVERGQAGQADGQDWYSLSVLILR